MKEGPRKNFLFTTSRYFRTFFQRSFSPVELGVLFKTQRLVKESFEAVLRFAPTIPGQGFNGRSDANRGCFVLSLVNGIKVVLRWG